MVRKASCCCGEGEILVEGNPTLYGVCHCGNCKRRTGSAFGLNAYFDDKQIIKRKGDYGTYPIRDEQLRHFCTSCGTTLYWTSAFMPESTGIAAGCFVENPPPGPKLTVSNETKFEWLTLPDSWDTSISS